MLMSMEFINDTYLVVCSGPPALVARVEADLRARVHQQLLQYTHCPLSESPENELLSYILIVQLELKT